MKNKKPGLLQRKTRFAGGERGRKTFPRKTRLLIGRPDLAAGLARHHRCGAAPDFHRIPPTSHLKQRTAVFIALCWRAWEGAQRIWYHSASPPMSDISHVMALAGRVFLAMIFLAAAFGKITNFDDTVRYMASHGIGWT